MVKNIEKYEEARVMLDNSGYEYLLLSEDYIKDIAQTRGVKLTEAQVADITNEAIERAWDAINDTVAMEVELTRNDDDEEDGDEMPDFESWSVAELRDYLIDAGEIDEESDMDDRSDLIDACEEHFMHN
jgi:hypothetical protein